MLAKLALALGILVSAFISYRAFLAPQEVLAGIGLSPDGLDGRNEIRAMYGGFYLVLMGVLAASLFGTLPARFGLGLLLITVGGVLLGRLISMAMEGPGALESYSATIWAYLASDIVIAGIALWALLAVPAE